MDSAAWQNVFGGIRSVDQECLVIWMTAGMEIAVQSVARVEEDLVMIRGRTGGQAEGGRLFLVPYDGISTILVNRTTIKEEVELFAPSVSLERKEEVARLVAEMDEKSRKEAAGEQDQQDSQGIPVELRDQLEALRESAGFDGPSSPGMAPAEQPPAQPIPGPEPPKALPAPEPSSDAAVPPLPQKPSLVPKRGLPTKPSLPSRPKPPKKL